MAPPSDIADDDLHTEVLGKYDQFGKRPHCIYFYYIGPLDIDPSKTEHYNKILHYYDPGDANPLTDETLQAKIEYLIENAKKNLRDQRPPPNGENWKYVVWNRISYIVFAIDIPDVKFGEHQLKMDQKFGGSQNWSFFDATESRLVNGCTVITCINHMKSDSSFTEIGNDAQYFHFDLGTVPELQWEGKTRYPDSGGTNTGPPIGPPDH